MKLRTSRILILAFAGLLAGVTIIGKPRIYNPFHDACLSPLGTAALYALPNSDEMLDDNVRARQRVVATTIADADVRDSIECWLDFYDKKARHETEKRAAASRIPDLKKAATE